MLSLYNLTVVRPQLEYAVKVRSPNYRKDVEILQRVQRRANRMKATQTTQSIYAGKETPARRLNLGQVIEIH